MEIISIWIPNKNVDLARKSSRLIYSAWIIINRMSNCSNVVAIAWQLRNPLKTSQSTQNVWYPDIGQQCEALLLSMGVFINKLANVRDFCSGFMIKSKQIFHSNGRKVTHVKKSNK